MRITAFALIASFALAASPALAKETMSGDAGAARAAAQGFSMGKFSPKQLSRTQIMKIQAGLDKAGFNAGPVNGKWGPRTQKAGLAFLKSKHKTSVGQLTNKDLADLGLNRAMFMKGARHYATAPRSMHRRVHGEAK